MFIRHFVHPGATICVQDARTEGEAPMPDDTQQPLKRRLFVLRLAALGGATAATAGCVAPPPGVYAPAQAPVYAPTFGAARTGISDSDPGDPPGGGRGGHRGSGVSDSDPNDRPGFGRGGVRYTGASDADPNDPPGRGRGGYRGAAPGYRTGVSDSDPNDAPGRGRGGYRGGPVYRTGVSDSDPRDAPGRGRRGY
jgi:hypothetical protein